MIRRQIAVKLIIGSDHGGFELKQEIQIASQVAEEIALRRAEMEQKVRQLSPQSIDVDMLEESARTLLNMGQDGDYVILDTTE